VKKYNTYNLSLW